MENQIVERIYEYDNYRSFLKDYFTEQKRCRNCFSYRFFAQRAGFASSSFCAHVIDGKRNLTSDSLRKMIRGLKLNGKAASYFEALVSFNQAKTVEDREHWFRVLERLRKSTLFYKVNHKQYAYYDEWYYPVVRELAVDDLRHEVYRAEQEARLQTAFPWRGLDGFLLPPGAASGQRNELHEHAPQQQFSAARLGGRPDVVKA